MPYQYNKVSLDELWRTGRTGQPSMGALRSRVYDNILIYEGSNGATQLFDEQLSLIRLRAASACKRPTITWNKIKRALRNLDRGSLNPRLKKMLDAGASFPAAVEFAREAIDRELAE